MLYSRQIRPFFGVNMRAKRAKLGLAYNTSKGLHLRASNSATDVGAIKLRIALDVRLTSKEGALKMCSGQS